MEHETKTMLTQKIRAVESGPVTWNKQVVWRNVRERVKARPKYRYYLAAAVILGVVFAINPLRLTETPEAVTNQTNNPMQSDVGVQGAEAMKDQPSGHTTQTPSHPNAASHVTGDELQSAVDPALTTDRESIEEPLDAKIEVELVIHEPSLNSETVVKETIQPIVGVVGWSDQDVATKKSKKKQLLRGLDPSDPESGDDTPAKPILFARIK